MQGRSKADGQTERVDLGTGNPLATCKSGNQTYESYAHQSASPAIQAELNIAGGSGEPAASSHHLALAIVKPAILAPPLVRNSILIRGQPDTWGQP